MAACAVGSCTAACHADGSVSSTCDLLRTGRAGPMSGAGVSRLQTSAPREWRSMDRPRVFIGSSSERLDVARNLHVALEQAVKCEATVWDQNVFTPSEYALESLTKAAREADFAILIAAPDDLTESRGERGASPRDNVILELGLFIGILGVRRVLILCPEVESGVRLPSDLFGLTRLPDYRARRDGNLLAALNGSVLAAKKVIEEQGSRSTRERPAATSSVHAAPSTRHTSPAVVTTTLARYGLDSLLANSHPARFAELNQNRPCVHLRAVWRPSSWEQGLARLTNPAAFLSTVPTAVLDRWHSYYARNGGVGGPQQAALDATHTFDSFFVAEQDCARSAGGEPEASVRSALALFDGGPCLRFIADVSLSVPVGPLPASGVLGSLADLARHAMRRCLHGWLTSTARPCPRPGSLSSTPRVEAPCVATRSGIASRATSISKCWVFVPGRRKPR